MLNEEIEVQRQRLNEMMAANNISKEELLRASEELDILIVKSMRSQRFNKAESVSMKVSDIQLLMDKLKTFKDIFSIIRLIDPSNGNAYNIFNNELVCSGSSCFDFWKKKEMCDNCIAMKAYREHDTFFKMNIKENRVFLIAAFPTCIDEKCFIVEMLKDVTNGIMLNYDNKDEIEMPLIEYFNKIKKP